MGKVLENPLSELQGQPVLGPIDRIIAGIEARLIHLTNVRKIRMGVKFGRFSLAATGVST